VASLRLHVSYSYVRDLTLCAIMETISRYCEACQGRNAGYTFPNCPTCSVSMTMPNIMSTKDWPLVVHEDQTKHDKITSSTDHDELTVGQVKLKSEVTPSSSMQLATLQNIDLMLNHATDHA
jgi:hypothetical protein